ncbi:FKBP-type peptidyl-prolyl cis-trans isomerase SlyD [Methylomarinovum caldicuralii]|uniref:Peptidyl-prolyl cis-trans isomerase n=1 Tax=Methylomarinovum caldicuralii TaxID=438856 RepID=A0AAU9BRF3_9GAMM|nr:peptidylprolyl isomerase [Methylomarinovum caldicuralii]BCX81086.1 FKBP-type peptidyl-prolyl cis-trans isomerase SlyD [Methylomarinovum caldicuralii]
MQVSENKVVSIHYTLKNDAGEVIDSSEGREPLTYLHGVGNIIPGLEKALEGKDVGEHVDVSIAPEEAYGERNDALVQAVPRSAFEGVDEIKPGMQFQAQTPAGMQILTVVKVEGDEVIVDGNHPLAGETLHFSVDIADVRDATEEEKRHGQVH